jgi:pyrroloquinoline quinone biosynthesis protein D
VRAAGTQPSFALSARPRLAPSVRVRRDRATGGTLLLQPERGLVLSATAARIVALCSGERTAGEIASCVAREAEGADAAQIERDTFDFLQLLARRRLIVAG